LVVPLFRTKWRHNSPFSVNPAFLERIRITDFLEKNPVAPLRENAFTVTDIKQKRFCVSFRKKVITQSQQTLSVIQIIFFSCTSTF